jgi:UDP-N-acetylglucosamine 2-epimerase (non-hydrolysing)
LHRPALVDDVERLHDVLAALNDISAEVPLLFPVHPRTRARIADAGLDRVSGTIRFTDPVGYLDFLNLQAGASLVLTDSGGIQEETTVLGVPCLTLRENTERPITITHGTNTLVGLDPDRIRHAASEALHSSPGTARPPLWDGLTSERIAAVLTGAPFLPHSLGCDTATPTSDSALRATVG